MARGFGRFESRTESTPGRSAKYGLFEFFLGLLFCVGLPAFVTAVAPVSRVHLSYDGTKVSAESTTSVFFLVPYRRQTLDQVVAVETTYKRGEVVHRYSGKRRRTSHAESTSTLVLRGPGGETVVEVSPINRKSLEDKAKEFLAHPSREGLSLLAIANWKVGAIAGGVLSLFTPLFVVGWTIQLARNGARIVGGDSV